MVFLCYFINDTYNDLFYDYDAFMRAFVRHLIASLIGPYYAGLNLALYLQPALVRNQGNQGNSLKAT